MAHDNEKIAQRAYQLWLGRGSPEGDAESDWLEAERALGREAAPAPTFTIASVDEAIKESFSASDPPAIRLSEKPPSNADPTWKAAGKKRR